MVVKNAFVFWLCFPLWMIKTASLDFFSVMYLLSSIVTSVVFKITELVFVTPKALYNNKKLAVSANVFWGGSFSTQVLLNSSKCRAITILKSTVKLLKR